MLDSTWIFFIWLCWILLWFRLGALRRDVKEIKEFVNKLQAIDQEMKGKASDS